MVCSNCGCDKCTNKQVKLDKNLKKCTKCNIILEKTAFDSGGAKKNKNGEPIYKSICKTCRITQNKEYYLKRKSIKSQQEEVKEITE